MTLCQSIHNKYRLYAPAGPDAKTAAQFSRRSGKRYGAGEGLLSTQILKKHKAIL